jgi:RimJ/RimL family protein N-acetyltransferase
MARKAFNMSDATREYPRTLFCDQAKINVRLMSATDADNLKNFIATLPAHDLLFLARDITHPKVIAAWLTAIDKGIVKSLVAEIDGGMIGCTAIVLHELSWSRHVGELRVLLSPAWRGIGVGRGLIQECFAQALELGLSKLSVQMTVDQRGAIAAFESLGFRAEAIFRDHVKDRDGKLHDLAVLSHDVSKVQSRMAAYGVADAVGN